METMFYQGPLAFDTPVFIYFLEDHPRFAAAAGEILRRGSQNRRSSITSVLTISEVAAGPYRLNNSALAAAFTARIKLTENLRIIDVDPDIAQIAARIRGQYNFRLPDAIHLATALQHDASTFITNDRRLQRFQELPVTLLSEFVH